MPSNNHSKNHYRSSTEPPSPSRRQRGRQQACYNDSHSSRHQSRLPQDSRRSRSPRRRSSFDRSSQSPRRRSRSPQHIRRSRSPHAVDQANSTSGYGRISREELERRLRRAESRIANAERRARDAEEHRDPSEGETPSRDPLIPRPPRASRMPVSEMREMLGVSKLEWNNIRTTIRHNAQAARLDYDRDLRNQKSNKLTKLCNASAEIHPVLNRFENHWGIERLAKEYFRAHKTYRNCVRNSNTYRGARAPRQSENSTPARHSPASPSPRHDEHDEHDDDEDYISAMQAVEDELASQPIAGPSRTLRPRVPPTPTRPESPRDYDEEAEEDQDIEFSTLQEDDEEEYHGKGKGRGKGKGKSRSTKSTKNKGKAPRRK